MTDLGTDILLERRHEFSVHGKHYTLYPPSLGITMMLKGGLETVGLDFGVFAASPVVAVMSCVDAHPLDCCRLIALGTCRNRDEAMSSQDVDRTAKHLHKWLNREEVASLMLIVISANKVAEFLESSGIGKETERLRKVSTYKKNDTPTFGGKTIFGQLVDPACERYGWTYEYAVWGISYAALTAMMADKVTSVILTEEEKKKIPKHLLENEAPIKGDDPRNWQMMQQIMDM